MSATEALRQCPVCNETYLQSGPNPVPGPITRRAYTCKRCGEFALDEHVVDVHGFDKVRNLISAWIRRQNNMGMRWPTVGGTIPEIENWFIQLVHMGFPKTTGEKLDALLKAYANIIGDEYSKILKLHLYPNLIAEVAAKNFEEVRGLNTLLKQLNYVDFADSNENDRARIRAEGWFRIDELRKSITTSDSTFVAMWFEDEITGEYRKGVIKAVEKCGYNPIFVDQEKFNGFIMDQVVTLIRQARFIIADYTTRPEQTGEDKKVKQGVRGGVYWEAGFAYGLGKPVIHTCEDDEEAKRRIHFDVDQYKTIYWKRDELGDEVGDLSNNIKNPTFVQELAMYIHATVGKGSYVPEKK